MRSTARPSTPISTQEAGSRGPAPACAGRGRPCLKARGDRGYGRAPWSSIFGVAVGLVAALMVCPASSYGGGITPEQIYQPKIEWEQLIGTWEILPDDGPLAEKGATVSKPSFRVIMALRKDGTCRVFSENRTAGEDGLWTLENRKVSIALKDSSKTIYHVYGVKGDFMVTSLEGEKDVHQLWSRVK
ncbi:MAG: hypothetical protein V2B18_18620 [Pseudomonadota bacterium]